MTFVQDNRNNSSTMTEDNRTAAALLTQDTRTTSGNLWTATIFPWLLDFPWLWSGTGETLTLDTRH